MNKATELHSEAMALAEKASIAKLRGEMEQAKSLFYQAFLKERDAASRNESGQEPTRSVLYRSAASLAIECEKLKEAEHLVYLGLSGAPPLEIYDELRTLLEDIGFCHHLSLHGITLLHNEFQMSMWGDVVAHGMTRTNELIRRAEQMKKLVRRTAERKLGKKFREGGRPEKVVSEAIELYVSAPRAASFAISFRIGASKQLSFPGVTIAHAPDAIIDDIFENFELFNESATEKLRHKIEDPAYYRNFIGLAREIAPDGEAIKRVGLTTMRQGKEHYVKLTLRREEAPGIEPEPIEVDEERFISVQGQLLYADEMKEGSENIKLKDERGNIFKIKVPSGMMSDIVRPMWESEVMVSGFRKAGWITLEDIKRIKE